MRSLSLVVTAAIAGLAFAACSSTSLAPLPDDDAGLSDASSPPDTGAADVSAPDTAPPDATPDVAPDAPPDASPGDGGIGGCGASRDSGNFPVFTDACTSDHDCVLVIHQLDCCGSQEAIGINVTARNDFDADEATWRNSCPGCGCAAQPTVAQDGNTGPISSMRVTCAGAASGSGVCRTYVQM